jgi:hypothetical protein
MIVLGMCNTRTSECDTSAHRRLGMCEYQHVKILEYENAGVRQPRNHSWNVTAPNMKTREYFDMRRLEYWNAETSECRNTRTRGAHARGCSRRMENGEWRMENPQTLAYGGGGNGYPREAFHCQHVQGSQNTNYCSTAVLDSVRMPEY